LARRLQSVWPMETIRTARIAIAVCRGRVAPLFDSARCVRILEAGQPGVGHPHTLPVVDEPLARVGALLRWDVGTLICGAISLGLASALEAHGVLVLAFVSGDLPAVLQAFRQGTLSDDHFRMPGCRS
jgi:hypothetical protein